MKYINVLVLFIIGVTAIFLLSQTIEKKKVTQKTPQTQNNNSISSPLVIAKNLDTPWGIAFLPDNSMLITERPGRVQYVDKNGNIEFVATIKNAKEAGEGGLLGIALHPKFSENNYIYLYYTYNANGDDTLNRVVRMTYKNNKLSEEKIIVDKIPGASNHNGGRIKFGPDNFLYITTGDAQNPSQAQKIDNLAGKILRVTDEGEIIPGNPFKNLVYSYGHRNPQGLAWDSNSQLWETEHGPSGGSFGTGNDEINKIEAGKNYGWPKIQGDETSPGMVTPKKNSGATTTWAPAGTAFFNNSLFFAGLRGQALFEAVIENNQIVSLKEHFKGTYGRIRDVILGADNMLYITTSNRDGRGNPDNTDDRIIRINPSTIN